MSARGEPDEEGYAQVIIDFASLKVRLLSFPCSAKPLSPLFPRLIVLHDQFILDPAKKGSQSAAQLIDDLSDVVDRYLEQPIIKAREESLDVMVDELQDLSLDQPFVNAQETPSTPRNASCPTANPSSPPHRPLRKRFTLLVDPPQMLDKNYATRKEKARAFLGGLFDAEKAEMVHIGFGRKSVEEQIIGSCSASYSLPSATADVRPYVPDRTRYASPRHQPMHTSLCSGRHHKQHIPPRTQPLPPYTRPPLRSPTRPRKTLHHAQRRAV